MCMEDSLFNDLKKKLLGTYNEKDLKIKLEQFYQTHNAFDLTFKNKFYVDVLTDDCFICDGQIKQDDYETFYTNIASSGVGLIITGGTAPVVRNFNKKTTVNENKFNIDYLSETVSKIHAFGSKVFFKIKPNFGRFTAENKFMNIFPYSASLNPSGSDCRLICARFSDQNANELIDDCVRLAKMSQIVGFDGVVVDGSLNNIVGEFSLMEFNKRFFGYYSELGELVIKIVNKINNACKKYPIVCKTTLFTFASKIFEESLTNIKTLKNIKKETSYEQVSELLIELVKNGADGFIFNFGLKESEFLMEQTPFQNNSLYLEFYKKIEELLLRLKIKNKYVDDVVYFVKDNINFSEDFGYNFFDITKNIYADLDYLKLQKTQKIHKNCIKCNKCIDFSEKYAKNICVINPELFFKSLKKESVLKRKNVAVVGGGISGIYCALTLANRGHKVDLYEQNSELNKTGKCLEIFGYDKCFKTFNDSLNKKVQKLVKLNKINLKLNTKYNNFSESENDYDSIVVATGFKEKFLTINGAVQKHVKSIYDVLTSLKSFENKKHIVLLVKSELGLKLALYLLTQNKHVSLVVSSPKFLFDMPNANLTYYLYALKNFNAKVYLSSYIKQIHDDSVELVVNTNTISKDFLSTVLNMKANTNYKFSPRLKIVDMDMFVYEPQTIPNNKLYYDIVTSGYKGEVYLIGNALQIGDIGDDIKSAFYVGKNIWH